MHVHCMCALHVCTACVHCMCALHVCTAHACQVRTACTCQVRCIELHRYVRGGGLTELAHKDVGSTLTLSVQVKVVSKCRLDRAKVCE